MTTILGIDPGSRVTGFGVINWDGHKAQYLASGCIRVKAGALPDRLCEIHCSIKELMEEFKPKEFSIESVFMHQNAQSALKLGQARGVALVVARLYHAEVFEYSPRQVKQSVVGYGAASKSQVQEMIKSLLKLKKCPPSDAADALAIALTHAQNRKFSNLIKQQLSETKL